ncbi:MAG: methylenetetrahydrofolate reductase [Oscillospiraceae bacterium]|jgi:methylenetetrahydrofolate reductase (NADPH)|nr:methylenetetrahydrofolate reductase [Oscillospiraceae bacterium]
MRISELLAGERVSLSFEVFPPKKAESFDAILHTALEIAALQPSFMSITYGAGGSTDQFTRALAQNIQQRCGVPALAHLTCYGTGREQLHSQLAAMREAGIENILALRGDLPEGVGAGYAPPPGGFQYAAEMVREIKGFGGFCIGAACYPEGHVECPSPSLDRQRLKAKVDQGVDFLTTQMFFDNDLLYKFLYQIRELGVSVPIIPGIMPVTKGAQIVRICKLSGTYLPARFRAILDKYGNTPAAMQQAGIVYACEQIVDLLAGGIRAVHVYSMNKPAVAAAILANLRDVL